MKKFKKIVAVLMSVTMIVCMFAVSASATSIFDNATNLKALNTVSVKNNTSSDKDVYFKINLTDSGKIKFHYQDKTWTWGTEYFYLMNSNGDTIVSNYLSNSFEKEYNIDKKGTYYVRLKLVPASSGREASSITDFYYTFTPNNTPAISLSISMKVGDKIDFSAVTSNYKGNITWKTTKSSVATVSKGAVTAKKKGTAQIRAYMDNGDYAEITVKVKK